MKTKQTPQAGSKSHRPVGMTVATFTSRGRDTGDPEEQFGDAPEDIEDEDLPKVLEDAHQPKEGEPGTSKSKVKTGETVAQATEEAEAPPEETLLDPNPTEPQPGTSTELPEASADEPTQDPTRQYKYRSEWWKK